MESHPQNPEFRNNPENFRPCIGLVIESVLEQKRHAVQGHNLLGDILGGRYIFFILLNLASLTAFSSSSVGLLLNLPYIKVSCLK